MKQLCASIMVIMLSVALAWADEPAAEQTRTRLQSEAQQMVALGVSAEAAAQLQNHFQETQMVQVSAVVKAAKAEGLPVEPLVDKALEGIAKNVSAERIVQAMQQVRGRYTAAAETAQEITPTQSRQRTLTRTMAQAMAAGMTPEEIRAIADRLQTRKRDMTREECDALAEATLTAARDMVRMGASSETVAETLNVALEGEYTAEQMQRIRSQFMHQTQQTDADMVANQFRERVRSGQDVADSDAGDGSGAGHGKDGSGSTGNRHGDGTGDGASGNGGGGGGNTDSGSGSGGSGGGDKGGSGSGSGSGSSGGNSSNDGGGSSGSGGSGSDSGSGGSSSSSGSTSSSGSGDKSGSGSGGSGGSGSAGGSGSGGGKP